LAIEFVKWTCNYEESENDGKVKNLNPSNDGRGEELEEPTNENKVAQNEPEKVLTEDVLNSIDET